MVYSLRFLMIVWLRAIHHPSTSASSEDANKRQQAGLEYTVVSPETDASSFKRPPSSMTLNLSDRWGVPLETTLPSTSFVSWLDIIRYASTFYNLLYISASVLNGSLLALTPFRTFRLTSNLSSLSSVLTSATRLFEWRSIINITACASVEDSWPGL